MIKILQNQEEGNGILEMLLFVPLALLLLFVGIDTGLSFVDKSMVTDAVRETVHNQLVNRVNSQASSVYQATASGVDIDVNQASLLAQSLADRLATVIAERRVNLGSNDASRQAKVNVTPVRIQINTNDGTTLGYSRMLTVSSNLGNPSLTLGSKVEVNTSEELLNSRIVAGGNGYAIPSVNYSNSSNLYLPESLGYLVEVEALSPSINSLFLEQVLGSRFGIQIQDFHVLRN